MKIRKGFVSNSSSTSFIITNTSDEQKDLVDFVKENPELIKMFKKEFDWYREDSRYTQKTLIESARTNNIIFPANSKSTCIFGDESGTIVGHVFDYILRSGGHSENFKWKFKEYQR